MRERTEAERLIGEAAFDKQRCEGGAWSAHLWGEIQRLRDGAVEAVLAGLEPSEYRYKLGFIAALDDVLRIPGELDERNEQVKDSLNAG